MMGRQTPITLDDPLGSEPEGWRPDLILPSFFLIAATLILGIINPVYLALASKPIETILAVALISTPVIWGLLRGNTIAVLVGSGLLLGLVGVCLLTQPNALGVPVSSVWPLRVLLLLLVAGSWLFLLRPPLWVRRAVVGLVLTLIPLLICAGAPLVIARITAVQPTPTPLFSPYWLAIDSAGRLYAAASQGGAILVFSPEGVPLGTFRPHLASEMGSNMPDFRPVGFPTPTPELYRTGTQIGQPIHPPFTFCGLAIDSNDKLYVVDPSNLALLRVRLDGTVEKRIAMPDDFQGARGCLAADSDYIYVASRYGIIYILDYEGRFTREVKVDYLPFSISADGKGNLLVIASDHIDRVDVETGQITRLENPPPLPGAARSPYQALVVTREGELVVNDLANAQVLRIAPEGGQLLGTIGEPGSVVSGYFPGQFGGLGGLAQDKQGRIYVADWQLGVIQRFNSAGDLEAVITAPGEAPAPVVGEEEE